jgi:hypothetical protein
MSIYSPSRRRVPSGPFLNCAVGELAIPKPTSRWVFAFAAAAYNLAENGGHVA